MLLLRFISELAKQSRGKGAMGGLHIRGLAPVALSLLLLSATGCPNGYVVGCVAGLAMASTNGMMWVGWGWEIAASKQLTRGLNLEAAQSARNAISIFESMAPEETCHIACCLSTLGLALKDEPSRRADAIEALRRSISMVETAGDDGLSLLSTDLGHLGEIFVKSGDIGEAEPLLQRALTLNEQHKDPCDNKAYAKCLHNLGVIRLMQGRMDEASGSFDRAIAVLTEKGEAESPEMAMAVNGKAFVLFRAGENEQAKTLMVQATALLEKVEGSDNLELAKMQHDLACVHKRLGEYDEARRLCNRALAVYTRHLDPESPEIERIRRTLEELPSGEGS